MDERLRRAGARYTERIIALGVPDGGGVLPYDASRGLVAGTDLPFDDLVEVSRAAAAEFMVSALQAGTSPLEAFASAWRAGVMIGVLFAQEAEDG